MEHYENKEFTRALHFINDSQGEVPDYLIAFYGGLAAMQMDPSDLESAINSFDSVLSSDNDYREQALWYKALALIKLDRSKEAETILTELVSRSGFKYNDAAEVLERISD